MVVTNFAFACLAAVESSLSTCAVSIGRASFMNRTTSRFSSGRRIVDSSIWRDKPFLRLASCARSLSFSLAACPHMRLPVPLGCGREWKASTRDIRLKSVAAMVDRRAHSSRMNLTAFTQESFFLVDIVVFVYRRVKRAEDRRRSVLSWLAVVWERRRDLNPRPPCPYHVGANLRYVVNRALYPLSYAAKN